MELSSPLGKSTAGAHANVPVLEEDPLQNIDALGLSAGCETPYTRQISDETYDQFGEVPSSSSDCRRARWWQRCAAYCFPRQFAHLRDKRQTLSTTTRIDEKSEEWCVGQSRFTSFGHGSLELRWRQLSLGTWQTSQNKEKSIQILKGVSGTAKSGQLTCILGPSGSGKTTLLNVLAGRQSGGNKRKIRITGQVWAAGQQIDPRAIRSRIAYVMQKDEMFATATPREALKFSAALRLSGPRENRHELISELLGSLGLLRCADTYIGNAVINGLSGGQRKRTAIGVELITQPDIVCLDEPTSGLDSFAAYQVVRVLKDLAGAGCTVICTLHQPSSEIFALVDHVICLCSGHCLYEGGREQMVVYFANAGYRCPIGFNPADFAIFLMQTEPRDRLDKMIERWAAENHEQLPGGMQKGGWLGELCQTPHGRQARRNPSGSELRVTQKSFCKQLSQLIRRELRSVARDRTTMTVRFCLSGLLAILFGLVFQGVGRTIIEEEQQAIFDLRWTGLSDEEVRHMRLRKLEWHFNALVQVAMVAMFSASQPVILAFPLERAVFLREHTSGTYNVLPYYLSKMAVEVPLVLVQSLLTLGVCYLVMCLNGDFGALLCTMVLLSVCSVPSEHSSSFHKCFFLVCSSL